MALTPFFRSGPGSSSVFDPFSWDPFPAWSLWEADFGFPSSQLLRDASAVANTQVDWKETQVSHIFMADLPGLKKEEVKVQVEDGSILSISGERSKEETQKTDKWHRVERSHGKFQRKFRLPDNAKAEEMTARVENGVLTIEVPKAQREKPNVRSIEITG